MRFFSALFGPYTDIATFFGLGALLVYFIHRSIRRSRLKYLPGPSGLPIIGNAMQLGAFPWLQMTKWSEEFGPIYSLNLGGTHAIVITSHKIACELLDKRSGIYSDRPRMIMTGEILCGGLFSPFNPYGDSWRKLRKAAYEGLNKTASEAYRPIHAREAVLLAEALHQDPSGWMDHINRTTASGVFSVSYSRPPFRSSADPIIKRMADFMHRVERSARPGAFLVDIFPWMLHIPDWMASWKREGNEWHKKDTKMFFEFYHEAKNRMLEGKCGDCLTTLFSGKKDLTEKEAAWTAGSMFGAGFSTTSAVQLVFILAMICNPDVMRKAQEEIDRVVGRKRLPTFEDRENMPYFRAVIRETFRWRSIGPLGLPHATSQDDVYEGHFIPKGTIVFYNNWGMNRAPGVFPEPDAFRPERYLDATGTQDYIPPNTHLEGHTTFGYGRRKCLGINVANNTLFLHLSTILWAFNIEKGKDANGNIVTPHPDNFHDEGMVVVPAPFPCEFVPRDPDVLSVLEKSHSEFVGSD